MSYRTWVKEYLPVSMPKAMTYTQAIALSRKKWDGMLDSGLKRHGISPRSKAALVVIGLMRDGSNCALCKKANMVEDYTCDQCPIAIYDKSCPTSGSAYDVFQRTHNPAPMRRLLKEIAGWWPKYIKQHRGLD